MVLLNFFVICITVIEGLAPANFSVTDVQSRNITFSWDAPETDLSIIGYTVDCSGPSNQNDASKTENVTTINATIPELLPFTSYTCSVFTRVDGNRGNNTKNINKQTSEESKN